MKTTEQLLESILHNVINYGETPGQNEKIRNSVYAIWNLNNYSVAFIKTIVRSKITLEVVEHADVYTNTGELDVEEVVKDFIQIFDNIDLKIKNTDIK